MPGRDDQGVGERAGQGAAVAGDGAGADAGCQQFGVAQARCQPGSGGQQAADPAHGGVVGETTRGPRSPRPRSARRGRRPGTGPGRAARPATRRAGPGRRACTIWPRGGPAGTRRPGGAQTPAVHAPAAATTASAPIRSAPTVAPGTRPAARSSAAVPGGPGGSQRRHLPDAGRAGAPCCQQRGHRLPRRGLAGHAQRAHPGIPAAGLPVLSQHRQTARDKRPLPPRTAGSTRPPPAPSTGR